MENIIYKSKIIKAVLIIIIIIYISHIYVEFFNIKKEIPMDVIKYISILLCFLITLISEGNEINNLDNRLLQIGMFFTVIADLFLVILNYHILGVLTFCIVQMVYIARYTAGKFHHTIRKLIMILILICSIYFLVNKIIIELDFLIPLGFFYSICLLISILKSIEAGKKNIYIDPNKSMIIWGMILFALCDLNVALARIELLHSISSSLIWIFYLPSQVLLSLSGYKY